MKVVESVLVAKDNFIHTKICKVCSFYLHSSTISVCKQEMRSRWCRKSKEKEVQKDRKRKRPESRVETTAKKTQIYIFNLSANVKLFF